MSQQGERRTHAEDDWWDRLYDEATPGTGPTTGTDHTVDDHFDSTPGMISDRRPAETSGPPAPPEELPRQERGLPGFSERGGPFAAPRDRAPWEPPEPPGRTDPPERTDPPGPPRTLGPDPRTSAPLREGGRTDVPEGGPGGGQEATGEWDAWLPTPRRRTGVEPGGPELDGRMERGGEPERDSWAEWGSSTEQDGRAEQDSRAERDVRDVGGGAGPEAVAESAPESVAEPAVKRPGPHAPPEPDVSTFPFARGDDTSRTSSTWGPPPSPPGPPGAPGPRPDRHRTRRLWDEPGPHGTPPPGPDPDATTVTGPAPGVIPPSDASPAPGVSPPSDASPPPVRSSDATAGPADPEADTGADGAPGAQSAPVPDPRRSEPRHTEVRRSEPRHTEAPHTEAHHTEARAEAPRRTGTRADGHLRNIPPLPTSFPPWSGNQDHAPDPVGKDRGSTDRSSSVGQDRGSTAEWEAPPVPPAAPLVPPATPPPPAAPAPPSAAPAPPPAPFLAPRPVLAHVGDGPPTYDAEPTALAAADPQNLDGLVADTVLDGAQYGSYTLRAASVRGDSARYRGEPRRDTLLTARFGSGPGGLVLVAVASGARAAEGAHLAAADACRWIAGSVGRSHARLAEDIRAGRRGDLKSGLHRLTDRSYGKLRAHAAELGLEPGEYTADLRCLLLSADPDCRTRIYFGVGDGGLFRLRDGVWQDIEPPEPRPDALTGEPVVGFGSVPADEELPEEGPDGDRLTMDLGITTPPSPHIDGVPPTSPFRFRASVARPGDVLLLSSAGLAEPVRGEPALAGELAARWGGQQPPPGLATFLADVALRVKGYADDRTAVAVWEA
ncbi:protein phosphatase 2C domain-containing protein [Streptomyces sp. NPDC054863]